MSFSQADPPVVPPPIPTLSPAQQQKAIKEIKKNFDLNDFLPLFPESTGSRVGDPTKYTQLSSRSGLPPANFVLSDLDATARGIYSDLNQDGYIDPKIDYTFSNKEFYKSYFSLAVDFDFINQKLKKIYPNDPSKRLLRGSIIYLEIYDKTTNITCFRGWCKANTDTQKDFIDNGYNTPFSGNKICLAVLTQNEAVKLQGKKAIAQVYLPGKISDDFIQNRKEEQNVFERQINF